MLVTTPVLDLDLLPRWLAATISLTGFFAFLVLAGFLSLVGNVVVGLLVFVLVRHRWDWPVWPALLLAAPFFVVFYRMVPKPF